MLPAKIPRKVTYPDSLKSTHKLSIILHLSKTRGHYLLQIVIKRSLSIFCKTLQQEKWLSCVQSLFSYIPRYIKKNNIKKKITKMYTNKLKREFKVQKSIQNKNLSKMKSKSKSFSCATWYLTKTWRLRTFLGQDEIPPSSLVQSKKRCLVGWAKKPWMVSKSSERREGDKGSKFGLMDYTKQTRQQITYNNLETGVCGQVFCAHIEKSGCWISVQCLGFFLW